jgi:hypothetical protein
MSGRRVCALAGAAVLAAALAACHEPSGAEQKPSAREQTSTSAAPPVAAQPAVTQVAATVLTSPASHAGPALLSVPRAPKLIIPSSRFDVDVWGSAVNTHTLLDDNGKGAVPVSEARFLWGQGQLYVAFYAGDLDLEVRETKHDGPVWKDDSVSLSFFTADDEKRVITVSPTGVLADAICPRDAKNVSDERCDRHWESHAHLGVDYDGTLNKLGDFDEEWNIQLAIPLRSLGAPAEAGTRVRFAVKRCDMAFDGQRSCGFWGNADSPGELLLQ